MFWKPVCNAIPCLGMGEYAVFQAEVEVASPYDVVVVQDHLGPAGLGEEVLAHDLVVALNPSLVELGVGGQVGVDDAERNSLDLKPGNIFVGNPKIHFNWRT